MIPRLDKLIDAILGTATAELQRSIEECQQILVLAFHSPFKR